MLTVIIGFFVVLLTTAVLYMVENYIGSHRPGQSKTHMLQPVYMYIKLFSKKDSNGYHLPCWFSVGALWFSFMALWLTLMGENFLLIISVLTMMELFVLSGAGSTGEPTGKMAAQRGIVRFVIWSFTCMLTAASLYNVTGTLRLDALRAYEASGFVVLQMPLAILALFVVFLLKGNLFYFDFGIAGKGLSFSGTALHTPYTGWSLAAIRLAHWAEAGVWLKLISLFLPWTPWVSFAITAAAALAMMLVDGFTPKLSWKRAALNAWIWAGGMAMINYIWLYII